MWAGLEAGSADGKALEREGEDWIARGPSRGPSQRPFQGPRPVPRPVPTPVPRLEASAKARSKAARPVPREAVSAQYKRCAFGRERHGALRIHMLISATLR